MEGPALPQWREAGESDISLWPALLREQPCPKEPRGPVGCTSHSPDPQAAL